MELPTDLYLEVSLAPCSPVQPAGKPWRDSHSAGQSLLILPVDMANREPFQADALPFHFVP